MIAARIPGALATAALLLAAGPAPALDYSAFYADELLAAKAGQYRTGLQRILNDAITPKLTLEERRALQGVRVEVPLRGTDPSDFRSGGGVVTMPAMSIRFLADVSVAYAWLQVNGYTLETVTDYLSMLKFQPASAFGGRAAEPRRALGIPDDADRDARVNLLADQFYDHSINFIFLHELGHYLYRHPGNAAVPARVSQANEEQADAFALEVLRRIGQPVNGLLLWFVSAAHSGPHRGDVDTDEQYERELRKATHPLTADRLRRLTGAMRAHAPDYARFQANPGRAAQNIREIADLVDAEVVPVLADVDQQRLMAIRGRQLTLAGLQPRRSGEPIAASVQPAAGAPAAAFEGVYDGVFTDRGTPFNVRTILRRRGNAISGRYSWGAGEGTIEGVVEGDTLTYAWRTPLDSGRGRVRASADGSRLEGTWGGGDSASGRGTWTARRGGR